MNLFVFTPISRIDCKCEFSIKTFFHFSILAFGLMDAEESHSEALRFFGNLIIIATKNFTLLGLMLIGSLYDRLHEDDLQLSPAIIFICFGIISGICIFQVLLQAVYYSNDFVFTKVWQFHHISFMILIIIADYFLLVQFWSWFHSTYIKYCCELHDCCSWMLHLFCSWFLCSSIYNGTPSSFEFNKSSFLSVIMKKSSKKLRRKWL